MPYQYLKTGVQDGVALIAINNPPVNALSRAALTEIFTAIREFQGDPQVRVMILTGEGANFAAGADVKEMAQVTDVQVGEQMSLQAHEIGMAIEDSPIPIIAAVNGYCFGGGTELALAAHLRIANDKARIGQPEVKLGIIAGMGGTQRLPRLVGKAKALEMLLTGEPISAQEAYRIGLVNAVVPETQLRTHAMGLAKKIAAISKVAAAQTLRAVREGLDMPLRSAYKYEARLFGEMMSKEDKKEGVSAFIEKRQPKFIDR